MGVFGSPCIVQWGPSNYAKNNGFSRSLESRIDKKSFFAPLIDSFACWRPAQYVAILCTTSVTPPSNFLSAMCMMSLYDLLSFSKFRIFSPINNNIGGRKVHVQLDDEKPAGRPAKGGSCSGRHGGCGPSFVVALAPYELRRHGRSLFRNRGWEKPTCDRLHSRNL